MRFALVTLLACSMFLVGCPKEKRAINAARKAVEVAAQTVDTVDAEHAALYTDAAATCLASHETSTGYRACVSKWDKTVLAVNSMKLSLLMVENSLDAWEAGSPNGFNNLIGAAACFTDSLLNLQGLLREVGAATPYLTKVSATSTICSGAADSPAP